MKVLIVLSALVAFSYAQYLLPYGGYAGAYAGAYSPLAYSGLAGYPYGFARSLVAPSVVAAPSVLAAPAVVPTVAKSQYHAQDELGQAAYGHVEPFQSHSAVQDIAGNKVGSFSYASPDGRILKTDYVADALGYRVVSNALPVGPVAGPLPVADTPEVVAARAAHLAAHSRARRSVAILGHTPAATAPLATAAVVAPYAAPYAAPFAYSAPAISYANHLSYARVAAPIAPIAPLAYGAPAAYAAPVAPVLAREATLTTVVNNPGHAISYRVD